MRHRPMNVSTFFLSTVHELPAPVVEEARRKVVTYGKEGNGGDDGAVVGRGKAGVHLADSAELV